MKMTQECKDKIGRANKKQRRTFIEKIKIGEFFKEYYKTHTTWNKGIKTGLIPKTAFKKGNISWLKGTQGLGLAFNRKGTKTSAIGIENIRKSQIGKKMSIEAKKKISKTMIEKGMKKGKNNPFWIDGRSYENNPYPPEWTEELRESIRERDGRICKYCGKTEAQELIETGHKLSVHHKDENKMNCEPDNLETCCVSCHGSRKFVEGLINGIIYQKQLDLFRK